jgi:lipoprotein-anchoring transpeptidase ErfK/SrfK
VERHGARRHEARVADLDAAASDDQVASPSSPSGAADMPGGLSNALGARALYLYNKGGDSGYRLHGTPEWWSIGKAMSSGCIRMMNQDIIDLHARADIGAKVIVK